MCQAAAYFQTLDIDVTEGAALVTMIDNGDGQAGYGRPSKQRCNLHATFLHILPVIVLCLLSSCCG